MNAPLKLEMVGDTKGKFPITLKDRNQRHVEVSLDTYARAGDLGMTLSQFLQATNPDADPAYGSVFEQTLMAAGITTFADEKAGLSSVTMNALLNTGQHAGLSAIVRPDGSAVNTAAGRLLVSEIILQTVNENLTENQDDFFNGIDSMVALTENIAGSQATQPMINTLAPEGSRAGRTSQLAEPDIMVSITTSERTYKIPTMAIGLTISDEAMQSTTLDLVTLTVAAQSRGERIANYEMWLAAMINGDTDMGETAVASVTAQSIDAAVTEAGAISHKAWIKFLRESYRTLNISHVMMGLDSAFAVESRAGRPNQSTDNPTSVRINANEEVMNLLITPPKVLLLAADVIGATTIVGIDSRYAIRRSRNITASYKAIEQYVMRRATSLRIDYAEMMSKLFPAAWKKITLTVS